MSFARELKRWAQAAVPPVIFLALTGYAGWSASHGDRGLEAMAQRQNQVRLAKLDLVRANNDFEAWDHRVAALRNGRLDPDALDERSRAMLNLAAPADVVVMYNAGKRLF